MLMQNQKLRRAEEIVSRFNNYNAVINLIELNLAEEIVSRFNNYNTIINLTELNFIGGGLSFPA